MPRVRRPFFDRITRPVLGAACVVTLCAGTAFAQLRATYLYSLASFSGTLPYDSVRVRVDRNTNEVYVVYQNLIRIFNPSGMEIFAFGDDLDLGHIVDAAVDGNGDIILLSYKDARPLVTRCNFRGVPIGPLEIRNLPEGRSLHANRLIYRDGLFYFVSLSAFTVTVTDTAGQFQKHIDFPSVMDRDQRPKNESEMAGFAADREGNLYFTVATAFKVYKLSSDGKLTSFGRSGGAPGRFGVLGGIDIDSRGNLLVTDKLKSVVIVFDKEFKFLAEFGYRGARPENLIAPDDLAVDGRDRLYVSQARRRGVSVFALDY